MKYAQACIGLWEDWLQLTTCQREAILRQAIVSVTATYMAPPKVMAATPPGGADAHFAPDTWTLTIDRSTVAS